MEAKLVVAKGKTAVKEISLGGVNTIIGRKNDCGLRIPSPLVSRQHCELTCAGDKLMVKDLGSSNGTFVNGSKIKQKELKSGDTLGVGPITFIVQLGGAAVSPSDTARPGAAVAEVVADDAADFVVAEEIATSSEADFVPAEEVPAAEADEAADFVVGEPIATEHAEESAEFVVVEDSPPTQVADVADFVVAQEATAQEADFVVAEVAADADTVHDANIADLIAADRAGSNAAEAPVAEAAIDDDSVAEAVAEEEPAPAKPQKKSGLFGRLFKKKDKKAAPAAPTALEAPPAPAKAKGAAPPSPRPASAKPPAAPAAKPATSPAAKSAEHEMPQFIVSEDEGHPAPAKPVGEDEMADFLMGLNEKEE